MGNLAVPYLLEEAQKGVLAAARILP